MYVIGRSGEMTLTELDNINKKIHTLLWLILCTISCFAYCCLVSIASCATFNHYPAKNGPNLKKKKGKKSCVKVNAFEGIVLKILATMQFSKGGHFQAL